MKINRLASLFVSIALLASVVVGYSTTASAAGNPNCDAVDGDYIVTFAKGVAVEREIKAAPGRAITAKYTYKNALNGFAAALSAEQVCAFEKRPNIEFIERDQTLSIQDTQPGATWGLDRIDQSARPLSGSYDYSTKGNGVTAYVIDTGIQTKHPDFAGSLLPGFSAIRGGVEDCNGHGTHVAGTIGGVIYGIAKDVKLVPVRVLDCNGSGSNSGVILGVDWVRGQALANPSKAVANMSLGGGVSPALDTAVSNLINSGVTVVVAAGNSNADACNSSPARVPNAITVAASDINDSLATFSNKGTCVDIIAPGVNIKSAWLITKRNSSGVNTISGTSMAAPHVAGVVARYLSANSNATPNSVATAILGSASSDKISSVPSGTPNKLLYAAPTS